MPQRRAHTGQQFIYAKRFRDVIIGAKLEAAMAALHEAHDALEGYEEAIEADHNSVGSVKLV